MSEAKEQQKIQTPPSILTPDAMAFIKAATSAAVKEAVAGIFAQMGPILQSIALTPEKLAEAEKLRRAPTEDEKAKKAREIRERKLTQQEAEENRQNLLKNQAACPHHYPTGQWSVNVVNNFPDRQPRFLCSLCQSFFEPRRWVILAPDADNPRGKAVIADAHKDYARVSEVLATKGV